MADVIVQLSELLGVSSSVVGTILFLMIAVVTSAVIKLLTGYLKLGILASYGPLLFGAVWGYLPIWAVIIAGVLGLTTVGYSVFFRDDGVTYGLNTMRSPDPLVHRIEESSKGLSQYINNLDRLLGIRTTNVSRQVEGGLLLRSDGKLEIDHLRYDWYLTAKHKDQDVFKVVGLHKTDDANNKVFLLGKSADSGQPFLTPISTVYLEGDLEECALYAKRKGLAVLTPSGDYTAISTIASIVPIVFAAVIILGAVNWISKGIK